jgi:imidazolonepropionase-like amidohydrolase
MTLLITNARLVDGTGAPARPDWAVLVGAQRTIEWIGPAASAPSVAAGSILDAGGDTVLPGLINSHVHLCSDAGPDFARQIERDSIPLSTLKAARMAEQTLACGVTSVRDCGAASGVVVELARAVDAGLVTGPRIVAAGRVITMTGGHGHYIGREADGVDAVRRATRTEIKNGADFVKLMATGGVLTAGVSTAQTALLQEELSAAVQEAHNSGRRTTAHAIGAAGIKNALRAGVDSIEHGLHLDDEGLQLALDHGAFLVPTLTAISSLVEAGPDGGLDPWVFEKATQESERSRASFVAAVRSGLKIAAGTDAGTPFNPHTGLVRELELMVRYGLTPGEVVVAATRNAAVNLDIAHRTGTVEVGRCADLLLVEGDPTADISVLSRVRLVVKDGTVVHRPVAAAA